MTPPWQPKHQTPRTLHGNESSVMNECHTMRVFRMEPIVARRRTLHRALLLACLVHAALGWIPHHLSGSTSRTRRRASHQTFESILLHQPRLSFWKRPTAPITRNVSVSTAASATSLNSKDSPDWIVYVDHSKGSLEKGAAATLDAFLGLSQAEQVQVKAAFLPKGGSGGGQQSPPWVRCVSLEKNLALEVYGAFRLILQGRYGMYSKLSLIV